MPKIDTVVIGASAGGVEALSRLVSLLPYDLPAAVLVVVHFPQNSTSVLPIILSRNGPLSAVHAADGMEIRSGQIYCAPPGRHLLLKGDHLALVNGPKENGNRPAIDPLFRSAASARRNRLVGILLSGMLDDGTLGTLAIRKGGGTTLCQDPEEAFFGDMPRHAIESGSCDEVLTIKEISKKVAQLVGKSVPDPPSLEPMTDPTEMSLQQLDRLERSGDPSRFVCPECQGTLFKLDQDGTVLYRCRVGHSYLTDSLSANQELVLEAALWTALRALEEHQDLLTSMRDRAQNRGFHSTAKKYCLQIEGAEHRLAMLRKVLSLGHSPMETEGLV